MSSELVTTYLAVLAIGAELFVATAAVFWLRGGAGRAAFVEAVGPAAPMLALAVAVVATSGSLYLSEVADFVPCKLCWYQRIAMYPLVPILGIAAMRGDRGVWPYGLALTGIGAALSTYHVLLERFPSLEGGATCDVAAPCSVRWVEHFGYLTIPAMALSGFLMIAVLLAVTRASESEER